MLPQHPRKTGHGFRPTAPPSERFGRCARPRTASEGDNSRSAIFPGSTKHVIPLGICCSDWSAATLMFLHPGNDWQTASLNVAAHSGRQHPRGSAYHSFHAPTGGIKASHPAARPQFKTMANDLAAGAGCRSSQHVPYQGLKLSAFHLIIAVLLCCGSQHAVGGAVLATAAQPKAVAVAASSNSSRPTAFHPLCHLG